MRRLVRVTFALSLLAIAACGPGASGDDDDDVTDNPCTGSGSQCVGNQYQECRDNRWVIVETCTNLCNANLGGCIDCNPGVNTCNGNAVVECGADGSFGGTVETCAAGTECQGGSCQRACSADGVDLIYVVDDDNNLLSFDPRNVGTATNPFSMIGRLNCPAGTALDGSGPATPFSMAIDRDATAWVLYSSGRIFNVSTQNAACTATGFTAQQNVGGQQWDLFGMGYVTDTAGGDTEKLWIGGGDADASIGGSLGWLTPGSLTVNRVGPLPTNAENSPELTGLGDATLWGFYPGATNAFVQQIDKTTGGGTGPQLRIDGGLGGQVRAWAFAQWGGKFYIFVTTQQGIIGTLNSTVRSIDRASGVSTTLMQNLPNIIVGAGVSTCAPVVIGREALPSDNITTPIDYATAY